MELSMLGKLETITTTSLEMGAIFSDKWRLAGSDGKAFPLLQVFVIFAEMDSLLIQKRNIEMMEIHAMEMDAVLHELSRRDGSESTTTPHPAYEAYLSNTQVKQQLPKQSQAQRWLGQL
jgi:hypothetical protein